MPKLPPEGELLWADWAGDELREEVPHRQVVFTIAKRLRVLFRYGRKLPGELAGCAWRALKLYFEAYFDGAAVTPGAVGFVQTAGELLNFHPHIHVLVTDGGLTPGGAFRPLAWFDSHHVERLFRAELLWMLLDKELVTEATVDNLLSWRRSGLFPAEARSDVGQGPRLVEELVEISGRAAQQSAEGALGLLETGFETRHCRFGAQQERLGLLQIQR